MSDLWTRLISNPYVLRSSPLVRSLFDILGLCYISEKPPLSLLGVANEPSFTQKASSRLIRKILNSCRDTSRQGVDQRGMQDLIPAVLYPLLNLASPIPGQGQPGMQAVRTCISKKVQVCLYCTSFTCLAFEQLYIWSYFQVSQRLKNLLCCLLSSLFGLQFNYKWRRDSLRDQPYYGDWWGPLWKPYGDMENDKEEKVLLEISQRWRLTRTVENAISHCFGNHWPQSATSWNTTWTS